MDIKSTNLLCYVVIFTLCLHRSVTRELNDRKAEAILDEKRIDEIAINSDVEITTQSLRRAKYYPRAYNVRKGDMSNYHDEHNDYNNHDDSEENMDDNDQMDMKAIGGSKVDYWGGYYDFLINEGSYKFWAVFQLATAALLIYSGFAALYYAKVNPTTTDDDLDDIFRRRRRRRASPPSAREKPFSGLDEVTFQRIVDAIAREVH